jgi:hypothetical protein
MDHFKDYIKSVVRSFKTPSVMGFKPTYKTDYIWVTVSAPPKMWTEDMSQEIYTALAGYVTSEVSRTITVRLVESRDPWTTRVLVVGGRGKPEDMEALTKCKTYTANPTTSKDISHALPTRTRHPRNKPHQRNKPKQRQDTCQQQ